MSEKNRGMFSVVIPTLQRAKELHELVEMCAAHPRVLEVLVINNAPEPLAWESPKVRVLQQAENIYVNPAWNLGAREARGRFLAIINDDVMFDPALFDKVSRVLRLPGVGMIGSGRECFEVHAGASLRLRPVFERPHAYGVVMFMRRSHYRPIPEQMRIFCGDDWLFQSQGAPNYRITGFRMRTDMSATSGAVPFNPVKNADVAWAHENGVLTGRYKQRFSWGAALLRRVRR